MALFEKKEKKEMEPQYYMSATNIPTYNYNVYHMSKKEKIIYFVIAFVVGAAVGYLFYGGIGKDEFGRPTTLTYILNTIIPGAVGIIAGILFVPIRRDQIIQQKKSKLNTQFRDMLETLSTNLGAGKNVTDSFKSVYDDLKVQYEEDAFILKELEVILSGMNNNIDIEVLLEDFGRRSGNEDIQSFANVFRVCYRKGGNIKQTIRATYKIFSDKMEIAEEIETMVTSAKSEQNIMIVMPIALIGIIKMMSPEFGENFVSPAGIIATTVAIVLFVAAFFVGRSITNIKM